MRNIPVSNSLSPPLILKFQEKFLNIKSKLEFTLCKAEQPLQGMGLQEKEAQRD